MESNLHWKHNLTLTLHLIFSPFDLFKPWRPPSHKRLPWATYLLPVPWRKAADKWPIKGKQGETLDPESLGNYCTELASANIGVDYKYKLLVNNKKKHVGL